MSSAHNSYYRRDTVSIVVVVLFEVPRVVNGLSLCPADPFLAIAIANR